MLIEFCPKAQKDVRRFGWKNRVLLLGLFRDLRTDLRLPQRLQPLPSPPNTTRYRIDLTDTYVARVRITETGLCVERIVTLDELDVTAADLFGEG